MKVAFVDVPNFKIESKKTNMPSFSLGYLSAMLETAGYDIFLLDSKRWFVSYKESYNKLINERPDIVCFTSTSENRFATIDLIRDVKKRLGSFIIVGGPHFTFTAEDAIEHVKEIDVVVRNEGEVTLLELVNKIASREDISHVDGITYRGPDGKIISNHDRKIISDLDVLPLPAWHLFDLDLYVDDRLPGQKDKFIGILSSRGCPSLCSFCANAVRVLRLRNPVKVVDEIEWLHKKYGYHIFKFIDDTITISKKHIEAICSQILSRKLDIIWSASARVDTVDWEMLSLMKKAGCRFINFGIESGSPRMLKEIKKNITVEEIKQAIRYSAELKFEMVSAYFMVSLPGETLADIDQTVILMKELKSYGKNVSVTFAYTLIYPGTEIEKTAKHHGILAEDFSWNTYHEFPNHMLSNSIPIMPYFEQKELKLVNIKAFLAKNYFSYIHNFKQMLKKVIRIKNINDFYILSKVATNYLFKKSVNSKPAL